MEPADKQKTGGKQEVGTYQAKEVLKQAELTQQFERDLAAIDQQIAEQKTRVERALKARDAAEADRKP